MSSPEKPEKTLKEKAIEWLESEGFPLEFFTAGVFHKNKFAVHQGFYVRDVKTAEPREIDVLAEITIKVDTPLAEFSFVRITHVVECKWSKDKPWIIFTSSSANLGSSGCMAHTIGSVAGEAIVWTLAGDKELHSLDAFSSPPRPGFGGRQAFNKSNDLFYSTLQSVTSLTLSFANYHNKLERDLGRALTLAVIAFPVVVVDGLLYETYFDPATGKMVIEETDHKRVHWRGTGQTIVSVDIVAASHLDKFVEKRREQMLIFLERATACLKQIHECYSVRSLKPLEVTEGSRGKVGLPPLLAAIKALGSSQPAAEELH